MIVVDTHTLFWYFLLNKKLSENADGLLSDAEKIFIPTIVVLELYYLLNKLKLGHKYQPIVRKLENSEKFSIVSLDVDIVRIVTGLSDKLEMHDRIIVATAEVLNLPLVTNDETIQKIYKNTIW